MADRWYPSSKTCSSCGVVKTKLRLGERTFICDHCGFVLDRDLNAARNLADLVTYVESAILLSNTLGTSLGDYLSDSSGLGYWGSAALIAAIMAGLLAAHYLTRISGVLLFWLAFILTRPLGATVGDLLSKPHAKGGLGFGTWGTSAALLAILVAGIIYGYSRSRTKSTVAVKGTEVLDNV